MKISFVSLGCDKNLVDSEIMLGIIKEKGHIIIESVVEADIIIVNTCGFISDATNESIEAILEFTKLKEQNCKGLIVTGCMAQRYKEEIFKEIPEVDGVVGTGDFYEIGEVIEKICNNEKVTLLENVDNKLSDTLSHKRALSTSGYAYLKISEGCDNKCTYCTIPSLRGKYRSRDIESLVEEAKILVNQDIKELILVAQDTTLYGSDLYGENKLHTLLQKLGEIEGLNWIRIMYAYPENIYDELIEEIRNNEKVCKYIDMPIQHSDDEILKLMGRRSSESKLKEIIAKLRTIDGMVIRTTLIVGFPGETDKHFENLLNFVEEIKFDRLGVFEYSKEEGTPASKMDNHLEEEVKTKRKNIIMESQKFISIKNTIKNVNKTYDVLVEGYLPDDEVYCGRTYMDCADVDPIVFFKCSRELLSGDFVEVVITKSGDYDLIGVIKDEFTK